MRDLFDIYRTIMKNAITVQFQYRLANYMYMIGMIAEPVIYLVVWSTIAQSQGGSVNGYTPGAFAAYYIVWTLVRNMNIVLTPYAWEWRIKQGRLSGELLQPLHPLHRDIAFFAGWKVVVILLWLPLALILSLIFQPTFNISLAGALTFAFAIWGAYLIRMMLLWLLGLITFWTTRVSAIFEVYFAAELLLSGRLVPVSMMPDWLQPAITILPFRYAFGFPIEALIGQLSTQQLLMGLGMQMLWIVIGVAFVQLFWGIAVRRYSAVGN